MNNRILLFIILFNLHVQSVHTGCVYGYKICEVEEWNHWSSCNAKCGGGTRAREKSLCCDQNMRPYTLDNCLNLCGIAKHWWNTNGKEVESCATTCVHGSYSLTHHRCLCAQGFGGPCCKTGENIMWKRFCSACIKYNVNR